jgi:hypothetical protein
MIWELIGAYVAGIITGILIIAIIIAKEKKNFD